MTDQHSCFDTAKRGQTELHFVFDLAILQFAPVDWFRRRQLLFQLDDPRSVAFSKGKIFRSNAGGSSFPLMPIQTIVNNGMKFSFCGSGMICALGLPLKY